MSVRSAIRSSSDEPMPWPEFAEVRSRTGRPDDVAACSAAANLRECIGFTRPSVAPGALRAVRIVATQPNSLAGELADARSLERVPA